MVSLSVFGVGWFSYDQSKDRHALFLGTAFLATGLIDFMHTLGNAAMPAFITANSTNKSTQYWIAARLLGAAALSLSAFVHPDRPLRLGDQGNLPGAALAVSGLVFTGVTFFASHLPATFIPGVGLTPFKVFSEYVVIAFLLLAWGAYWRRMKETGDELLVTYLAAFMVGDPQRSRLRLLQDRIRHLQRARPRLQGRGLLLDLQGSVRGIGEETVPAALRGPTRSCGRRWGSASTPRSSSRARCGAGAAGGGGISRLEAANREVEEKREWLRVTLSSIGDAVLACDTAGRVTFA